MKYPNSAINKVLKPHNLTPTEWTRTNNKFRPKPDALSLFDSPDDPDPDLLIESLVDNIAAGLYRVQGLDMPPMMIDDEAFAPMFQPAPGRGLWTLDDILALKEVEDDPDLINLDPFLNLALRPSDMVPDRLQGMTPRMAVALTGMRQAEVVRVARWMADQGVLSVRPNMWDFNLMIRSMGYGELFDPLLEVVEMPNMPRKEHHPPRNSKRSSTQQYALVASDPKRSSDPEEYEFRSLAEELVDHPPFSVDLGPDVHKLFHEAVELLLRMVVRAKATYEAPGPYLQEVWEKAESWDLTRLETDAVPLYLQGDWDFAALYTERLSAQQYVTRALVRCMAQRAYRSPMWRYQQPQAVLAISLMSGISPAIFVSAATRQLQRTGISFLGESHIDSIAQTIRALPASRSAAAQSRREDLVEELSIQLDEFVLARDELSPAKADEAISIVGGSYTMPAWGIGADPESSDSEDD